MEHVYSGRSRLISQEVNKEVNTYERNIRKEVKKEKGMKEVNHTNKQLI